MTEKPHPQGAPHGKTLGDNVTLTPADEQALDKAWSSITPADLKRSKQRLKQIQQQSPTPHPDK